MRTYDIIVIGTGGGSKIALPAAQAGLKVAVIEKDAAGGTCLNRGCIPSKMLIYPADMTLAISEAGKLDIKLDTPPKPDFTAVVRRTSEEIDGISQELRVRLQSHPHIDYYHAAARFAADRVIETREVRMTANKIFIAVGSIPRIPPIPGLEGTPFMTSREALRNTLLPKRLVVVGAGYIAVELGHAYGRYGADVHFIVRSRFLKDYDEDIVAEFDRVFSRLHTIHRGLEPASVTHDGETFQIRCEETWGDPETLEADALLVATGVIPDTAELGLENTGIHTDANGFIRVDGFLETDVKGVYALGDCVGNHFFRHTVNYEGEYLMRAVFSSDKRMELDYGPVPQAVFSHPQLAAVGKTEQTLRDEGIPYVVGKASYADSTPGMARRCDHGFVKLIVAKDSRRILGAQIVGEEASDMLHLFIAMMKKHGTLDDLLDMIFIHPALPEIARDAARDARNRFGAHGG